MKCPLPTLLAALLLALPAWAEMGHSTHAMQMEHGAMTKTLSEGVVRKVDKAQNKLTIRHGPLENLSMPSMTMVFRVKDAGYLDRLKPGDTILFLAESINGVLTMTRLEIAK